LTDDNSNTSDPNAKVTDSRKHSQNGMDLGYELRRGKGRLQAFYGAEAKST